MAQADSDSTAERTQIPEGEAALVDELAEFVNCKRAHEGEIAAEVGSAHQYLQKEMFDTIIRPLIIGLAAQRTDRRNERVVEECRDIVESQEWYTDDYDVDVPVTNAESREEQ